MAALTTVSFSCQPDGVKEAGFSGQQYKADCGSRASITELWLSRQHYKGQGAKSADKDSKEVSEHKSCYLLWRSKGAAPSEACVLRYSKCGGAAGIKEVSHEDTMKQLNWSIS